MFLKIRQEKAQDFKAVFDLIEAAFRQVPYSDHREQYLVENLRKDETFVPELSLVAVLNDKVVGHILLTKIYIEGEHTKVEALALAPVSVHPDYQNQGIGAQLIQMAHQKATALGFQSVLLIGHADYYPRFGYQPAEKYGIGFPFEVPTENAMAYELTPNALEGVGGMVVYPKAFFE